MVNGCRCLNHTGRESNVFEDGKCPMLFTDAIERYKLSDEFVERFCNKGCSVECGKFLERELKKTKRRRRRISMAKIFKVSGYLVDPIGDYPADYLKRDIETSYDMIGQHIHVEEGLSLYPVINAVNCSAVFTPFGKSYTHLFPFSNVPIIILFPFLVCHHQHRETVPRWTLHAWSVSTICIRVSRLAM